MTSALASARDTPTVCLHHPPICARNKACSRASI